MLRAALRVVETLHFQFDLRSHRRLVFVCLTPKVSYENFIVIPFVGIGVWYVLPIS